jgi:hypothetical protein
MRGKGPALIALGLPGPRSLPQADAAGFTHAAVRTAPETAAAENAA